MQQWLVPIIVALVAPFFGYLAAARKLSGSIETSEAAELWKEASLMRAEYRARAQECERQVKALRNEITVVIARNTVLRRENRKLRKDLSDALR